MGTYNFPTDQISAVASSPDFKQVNQFFVTYIGFNNAKAPFKDVTRAPGLCQSGG